MMPEQPNDEMGQHAEDMVVHNVVKLRMIRTYFVNPTDTTIGTLLPPLAPIVVGQMEEQGKAFIEVPMEWMGFFKALLQAPAQHKWAKQLLESGLPQLIQDASGTGSPLAIQVSSSLTCKLLGSEPFCCQ